MNKFTSSELYHYIVSKLVQVKLHASEVILVCCLKTDCTVKLVIYRMCRCKIFQKNMLHRTVIISKMRQSNFQEIGRELCYLIYVQHYISCKHNFPACTSKMFLLKLDMLYSFSLLQSTMSGFSKMYRIYINVKARQACNYCTQNTVSMLLR